MCATTKAVIKLFSRTYRERWGFFIMKGAASRIICTGFFERNTFIDHVIDINAINQFLDKAFWNHILRLIVSKSFWGYGIGVLHTVHHNGLLNKTKKELASSFFHFFTYLDNCKSYALSLVLINPDILPISARPTTSGLTAAITLLISLIPAAPVSEMTCSKMADTSSSVNA